MEAQGGANAGAGVFFSPPPDGMPRHGQWRTRAASGDDRIWIIIAVAGFFLISCLVGLVCGRFERRRCGQLGSTLLMYAAGAACMLILMTHTLHRLPAHY